MFHMVTEENASLYADELDRAFQLRYDYFVRERGWNVPNENGRERDQYDRADTVYLIKIDTTGEVIGTVRFLPTETPHLMPHIVPPALLEAIPRGKGIWEISRGVLKQERRSFALIAEYFAAVAELCVLWEIKKLVYVIDPGFFPTIVSMGWEARPIGGMFKMDGEQYLAADIRISARSLAQVRRVGGFDGPVIAHNRPISAPLRRSTRKPPQHVVPDRQSAA